MGDERDGPPDTAAKFLKAGCWGYQTKSSLSSEATQARQLRACKNLLLPSAFEITRCQYRSSDKLRLRARGKVSSSLVLLDTLALLRPFRSDSHCKAPIWYSSRCFEKATPRNCSTTT